ncbi:hypothetical protein CR513_10544, partial [Mucuna pruriens]
MLIAGKLRSIWDGPFVITNVFPYGAIELKDEHTNSTFQVNGHKLKLFHEGPIPPAVCDSSMIPTYGDFVMIKLFVGVFLTLRSIRSSSFVMQHLEAATMDQLGWPGNNLIAGSIGPPILGTHNNSSPPANNAKKLEWPLVNGMRCPNNP